MSFVKKSDICVNDIIDKATANNMFANIEHTRHGYYFVRLYKNDIFDNSLEIYKKYDDQTDSRSSSQVSTQNAKFKLIKKYENEKYIGVYKDKLITQDSGSFIFRDILTGDEDWFYCPNPFGVKKIVGYTDKYVAFIGKLFSSLSLVGYDLGKEMKPKYINFAAEDAVYNLTDFGDGTMGVSKTTIVESEILRIEADSEDMNMYVSNYVYVVETQTNKTIIHIIDKDIKYITKLQCENVETETYLCKIATIEDIFIFAYNSIYSIDIRKVLDNSSGKKDITLDSKDYKIIEKDFIHFSFDDRELIINQVKFDNVKNKKDILLTTYSLPETKIENYKLLQYRYQKIIITILVIFRRIERIIGLSVPKDIKYYIVNFVLQN